MSSINYLTLYNLQLSSKSKEIASYKSEISSFKQKKQTLEQQVSW